MNDIRRTNRSLLKLFRSKKGTWRVNSKLFGSEKEGTKKDIPKHLRNKKQMFKIFSGAKGKKYSKTFQTQRRTNQRFKNLLELKENKANYSYAFQNQSM